MPATRQPYDVEDVDRGERDVQRDHRPDSDDRVEDNQQRRRDPVNIASRIADQAEAGEILTSQETVERAADGRMSFVQARTAEVQGLAEPGAPARRIWPQLERHLDTTQFLDHARRDAASRGVDVDFVEGDVRRLPWTDERFDRVVSWFTSFGYFDDQDNQRVLRETHRVLRPGGTFLIENNLVELLPRWQPAFVTERDGHFATDRSCFDPATSRATTERVIIRGGRTRRFMFSVGMFVAAELRDWLLDAGFTGVNLLDANGDPLTVQSRRMISIAYR